MQNEIVATQVARDRHRRLITEIQLQRIASAGRRPRSPGHVRQALGRQIIRLGSRIAGLRVPAGFPATEPKT
jgi:hypothetical protein